MAEDAVEIRFMSGPGTLLEVNENVVSSSLSSVWDREVGTPPSYGDDGQNATGYHWPSGPRERTLRLIRPTSDEAVAEAIRLIAAKWDLTNVATEDGENAADGDWDAALSQPLEQGVYDETAVTVWKG